MQGDPFLPHQSKKKHPFEKSNIISRAFFWWLLPYFVKGFRKQLTEDDIPGPLKTHDSHRLGDRLEAAWNYQVRNKKKPSLLKALITVFYKELGFYGVFLIIQEFIVKLSQPLLISRFLHFFEPEQNEVSKNEAYICAGLIVIFALVNVMLLQGYYLGVLHLGMKLRVATCSLIYRKALKLSRRALEETTAGKMINLLSNDAGKFDFVTQYIHYLWLAPLETAVVMYLLYVHVGYTGLIGAVFLILLIFPQKYLGKRMAQCRSNTAKKTDDRIRLMSEIITGVQVIKMFAWEKSFAKLVELSRRKEMKEISATSIVRAIMITYLSVMHRSAVYLCIITYVLSGSILTASYAYTVSSFYSILRQGVTMYLPRAISQSAEASISVKRIQNFLLLNEMKNVIENSNVKEDENFEKGPSEIGISLTNVTAKWNNDTPENTLENVTFKATTNQLVAVVGKIGGSKTALLQVILKELVPSEGFLNVVGSVSYCSQQPWIFAGSIRQNILFGQKFIPERYDRIVRGCALERDFESFPNSDQTLVGDRGITLSGGQKARINLARAVYREADIYLLDDPLSAVDSHVGKHLFEQCICGYLKSKCVVLVTNRLQYLQEVDMVYLFENGRILNAGTYKKLKDSESDFKALLVEYENNEVSKFDITESDDLNTNNNTNAIIQQQNREQRSSGTVSKDVYKIYLKAGGNLCKSSVVLLMFVIAQLFAVLTDYFVTLWVNIEQWRTVNGNSINLLPNNISFLETNFTTSANNPQADFENSVFSTLDGILSGDLCVIIYTTLLLLSIIFSTVRSLSFFRFCMTASRKLHNLVFDSIIRVPLKFFNINSSGRILNRFSKDIGMIDEILPATIADAVQISLILLSVAIVIGSLNPWILAPTIVIVVIFIILKMVFLATSRDLKRIEAVSRSPIYTHLTSSVTGIMTIRASGAQDILQYEFDNYQNQYTAASFLFLAANRTFGFWLDFHCVVYTALILISVLFVKSEIFGGNVGYAITEAISLTGMFQFGIRQWTLMENQMTSVERVQEYIDETPELDRPVKIPPRSWPQEGHIKFTKLCLRYSGDTANVLDNVTIEIKPKEKLGIVGRTGAGKSSLIAALFRLAETDGQISIDNIDNNDVPLNTLRSSISIIPQEPILFSGTIRMNLDPFGQFEDELLWKTLEEVELKKTIYDLPEGLNAKVSENGSNFSVGQKQLICLARAIIRKNRILILDEATANVDPYTESVIQETIREKFCKCTVLTIAHRMQTVIDSDRIVVMDAGKVVEFDCPDVLLKNEEGIFYGLVREAGISVKYNYNSVLSQ